MPEPQLSPQQPQLSPQQIGEHFRTAYQSVSGKLHEWEQAKAALLVGIGRECLQLVRETLEPLPDHDLALRKSERAKLVKEIETALPADCEGIGVPQVNRWIRWAGACELLATAQDLNAPWGLKQSHLMAIEAFLEHNEARGDFRLKPSWAHALERMRTAVHDCVAQGWSAKQLDEALDQTASPEPKPVEPPPEANLPTGGVATSADRVTPTAAEPTSKPSPIPIAVPPSPVPTSAPPAQAAVQPAPSPSPVPRSSSSAPVAGGPSGPSPQDLANQAFQLLQRDEILAGVFRRDWDPSKVLALIDNLIRGCGEQSTNLLGLARAYHRLRPFVLTYFEEYADENRFKLRKKEQPEPPTLEQLAPLGELQTA